MQLTEEERHSGTLSEERLAVALNVPLCDFTIQNGSTEVWPATHLIVDAPGQNSGKLTDRAAPLASVRTNVPIGTLILRDMRAWHRGMPNESDTPRTMLALIYRRGIFSDGSTLSIPSATWQEWPERVKQAFRGNKVVPE